MTHFSRIRAPGFWTLGSDLLPVEMESIDACLSKAINGDGGGVWAPSSVIEIGGAGFKLTGGFWSTGAFRVDQMGDFRHGLTVTGDDVSISLNLHVQGNASVNGLHADGVIDADGGMTTHGNMTADGALGCSGNLGVGGNAGIGGTCMVMGATTLGGTLGVTGAAAFSSTLAVGGTLVASADVNVGGALSVNDLATFTERATFNGGVVTRSVLGVDHNNAYSVATVDEVIVGQTGLSTNVIYTVLDTGAVNGSRIRFTTLNANYNIDVAWTGGTARLTYQVGEIMTLELVYIGGTWHQALLIFRSV
jgi:hypothetical protein